MPPTTDDFSDKPRRWYWALLLALLCPGLGHVYATKPRRGIAFLAINAVVQVAVILVPQSLPLQPGFLTALAIGSIGVLVYLVSVIDAVRTARRANGHRLGRWNKTWVYTAAAIAWLALGFAGDAVRDLTRPHASYSLPSASMLPTLRPGDHILANRGFYATHPPEYGDVAVFIKPGPNAIPYIKRVVALPGDSVQLKAGILYLNGNAMPQTPLGGTDFREELPNGHAYGIRIDSRSAVGEDTPLYQVPKDHVFVLGDNRNNSADSRFLDEIGYLPISNLRDKVAFIYWSRDTSRIGKSVE